MSKEIEAIYVGKEDPFEEMKAVDKHLKTFGHLPSYECSEEKCGGKTKLQKYQHKYYLKNKTKCAEQSYKWARDNRGKINTNRRKLVNKNSLIDEIEKMVNRQSFILSEKGFDMGVECMRDKIILGLKEIKNEDA